MIPITECRQYLPSDWSDDEVTEFRDSLTNFIEGMLKIVEKSSKTIRVQSIISPK